MSDFEDEVRRAIDEHFRAFYLEETGRDFDWCGLCGTVHKGAECPPTPPRPTYGLRAFLNGLPE